MSAMLDINLDACATCGQKESGIHFTLEACVFALAVKVQRLESPLLALQKNNGTFEFTERQREIVELVVQGESNKEIASKLYVSEHTVRAHIRQMFDKGGFRNRVELAVWMLTHGV